MKYVLAIDQGTTGTTALVIDFRKRGRDAIVGRGYREFHQHFPGDGRVEHDLYEIWVSVESACRDALISAGISGHDVASIGITNQRETTGLWRKDGTPVGRAIVWQDRRTAPLCAALKEKGLEPLFRARTGLVLDPYFSGTKIRWFLDEGLRDEATRGALRFGTIDTWLVWQLTGGKEHVTDVTNASRTLLFDLHRLAWDEELCDHLTIPMSLLPRVVSSAEVVGKTHGVTFLPDGIPIAGIAGDQQAALFGQACFTPGMAKCTYGTGAFALANVGSKPVMSSRGMLTTVAWKIGDSVSYALEGSCFIAGAMVQWLRDGLMFFNSSAEVEQLAAAVPDADGVVVVPALTGLGAPYWRPEARGLISGISRRTNRSHIARAVLEGIALQVHALLDAMRADSGLALSLLRVDGGASANNILMQFQADILQTTIHRSQVIETTALGAAYLAAIGIGLFDNTQAISEYWVLDRAYVPAMGQDEVQARLLAWDKAVAAA